jgi:signal transduction histidine kinase/HAMP domain-containing protein
MDQSAPRHVSDLSVHADLLADGCKAAITFDDPADANDVLRAVEAMASVQMTCIYTNDSRLFATYRRDNATLPVPDPDRLPDSHEFVGMTLTLVRPIILDAERIGVICMVSNPEPMYARLKKGVIVIAGTLLISSLGAYLASATLQRIISSPILYLAGVARFVSEKKQYDIRAEQHSSDEVGLLIQAFNDMLEQIQQRDSALVEANEQLEARVRERTAELTRTNEKLTREVAFRRKAEQVLKSRTEKVFHYQKALVELNKHANEDLAAVMKRLAREAAKSLSLERVGIWLVDEESSELVCRNLYKQSENTHESGHRLKVADYPAYFQAVESSRILAANHAREDPRTREFTRDYLEPLGITSMMDARIRLHGKTLGVVCCEHVGAAREWTLEEQDFAASLADMIALQMEANERCKVERALARVNEHLAETVRELRRSNRELQDFAYVTAHDLKAPLRGIGTLTDWIAVDYADKFDEDGQEQLHLLKGRVSRMSELIDSILHYSEIGRTAKCLERIDLSALLPEIITQVAPPENVEIAVEDGLPTVVFERVRLVQIFQNLLSNAIKYMDKPQGRVRIGCRTDEDSWTFHVADNGPGIKEKYFEKIFQMFQTLASRDDVESTGIGLSVVKKIIELHGGAIWVESKVGEGTTFFFTLPTQQVPAHAGQVPFDSDN